MLDGCLFLCKFLDLDRITQRADGRKIAENMSNDNIDKVPIWEKANLTIKEASEYSNIGNNHIEE